MDKENLVEKCRRVSVVLTPLTNSEINKWRNQRKPPEKRRKRWQRGDHKKRCKKPQKRKLSVSSSIINKNCTEIPKSEERTTDNTTCGITDNEPVMVELEKIIRTNDTRDSSPPVESNESFPLWKYKRKRMTSVGSSLSDDGPSAKRIELDCSDMNLSGKALHINLKRLTAVDKPCADVQSNSIADEDEVELDINQDTASLIMDSCDNSNDTIGAEGINKEIPPVSHESQKSDETDNLSQSKDAESFSSSANNCENINGAPSDDENESEADNDEELTDLCLLKEPKVLVTKLEDVIDCLEDNRTFPDLKHLSREHLNIIRSFRHFADTSDDTSYCLVMSPDDSDTSDTDETLAMNNTHANRMRNRRRISSDGSSSSEVDALSATALPEDPQVSGDLETVVEETAVPPSEDDDTSEVPSPSKSSHILNTANEADGSTNSEETLSTSPLSCSQCQESFKTTSDKSNHLCASKSKQAKSSKSGNKGLKQKKHAKMTPKSTSTNCTVCSEKFATHEQLSEHIFKHTPKELQEAYIAAARDRGDSQPQLGIDSDPDDCVEILRTEKSNPGVAIMNEKSLKGNIKKKTALPVAICPCHTDCLEPTDLTVQIEMVLYCEVCKVLFRRSECLEMHYRSNAECNKNRGIGRSPRLFCSTCRVVLNTLSDMRKHLEKHVSINRHGTVTFVCNICRVVFFGVGTVFCTHWFNHEKDPMFVASRYSFPKLCVSHRGKNPLGKQPGEQYFFVAEYVCRFCKQQFSSDSDLSNHIKQECKGVESKQPDGPLEGDKGSSTASVRRKKTAKKVQVNLLAPSSSKPSVEPPAKPPTKTPMEPPEKPPMEKPKKPPIEPLTNTQVEPPPKEKPPIKPSKNPPIKPSPRPQQLPQSPSQILPQSSTESDPTGFYVKAWICDICNASFPTRRTLVENHAVKHFDAAVALERFNSSVERPYACTICRKAHGSLDALSKHWQTHDLMKYSCSACNETYYSLQAFTKHVIVLCRKHNPMCRVSFGTKGTCKLCKIAFKEVDDLKKHNIDYHGAGRIVGTRTGIALLKNSQQISYSKAPATVGSQNSISLTKTKTTATVPIILARHYPPIAPKTTVPTTPPLIPSPPCDPQSTPLIPSVQPPSANESVTNNQQINGPLVLNIAVPSVVKPPNNPSDQTSTTTSLPKVRALEDPTVQILLTQSNSSDSTISASLVTDVPQNKNSSTFALAFRDTTTTGVSVTQNDLTQQETIENSIITSLLQSKPLIEDAPAVEDETPDDQRVSAPANRVDNENNLADLSENTTTNNSDDIQILEIMETTKEKSIEKTLPQKSVEKTSPKKSSRVPESAVTAVDSDIEILSETSAQGVADKTAPQDETTVVKTAEQQLEKTDCIDESSESSNEMTLVKNLLSKPQVFIRVKNLSELQDENKNVNNTRVMNNKKGNTLTEHLMAHLKPLKSSPKQQTPSNGINSGENAASVSTLIPGRRILPNIPQRVQGDDSRRASPLISRPDQNLGIKPMNRVTPIPTPNAGMSVNAHCSRTVNPQYLVSSNIDERLINPNNHIQPANAQTVYVCPICPASYHIKPHDFVTHVTQHPNLPSNVQAIVRNIMNQHFPPSNQVQQLQPLPNQHKYQCLLCSNYETDSSADFQKHFLTHSQHPLTAGLQTPVMCYNPQVGGSLGQTPMNPTYSQFQYQVLNSSQGGQIVNSSNSGISIRPQLFRCSLCSNFQFTTYSELEGHVKTMHGNILKVSDRFVCPLCPNLRVFGNERMLKEHERTQHTFLCSICLKRFSNTYELDTHCDLHKTGQL